MGMVIPCTTIDVKTMKKLTGLRTLEQDQRANLKDGSNLRSEVGTSPIFWKDFECDCRVEYRAYSYGAKKSSESRCSDEN